MKNKKNILRKTVCPACAHYAAVPFYNGGSQPLATLAWPETVEKAVTMPRLPLDFVRCIDCGHVFNAAFEYNKVPYSDKPNLMFNLGSSWALFIETIQKKISARLQPGNMAVEIGHGDGSFLEVLSQKNKDVQYIGFDPFGALKKTSNPQFRQDLFIPSKHIHSLKPDIIISRHVLEHLTNPLDFLSEIRFMSINLGKPLHVYLEVPCIDNAIRNFRTVDFYYEHNSNFTTSSFTRMLEKCDGTIEEIGYGYGKEVIYGFARFNHKKPQWEKIKKQSTHFFNVSEKSINTIRNQLNKLHEEETKIAVWGGTGKAAAFMIRYNLDRKRFPLVVDSDISKVGTFVPGTGQKILFRDWLIEHPADIIIIPSQWRARDIIKEMCDCGIRTKQILIEHKGSLIDFNTNSHGY